MVENKIVIELKHVPFIKKDEYYQCQRYLVGLDLELALLVNFRTNYLNIKRILNNNKNIQKTQE